MTKKKEDLEVKAEQEQTIEFTVAETATLLNTLAVAFEFYKGFSHVPGSAAHSYAQALESIAVVHNTINAKLKPAE
jgi:hypothetical protein